MIGSQYGCPECCPTNAAEAWAWVVRLEMAERLVDESHLGISLRRCRACGQAFVMVFAEQVDWANGDDPQGGALVPVTGDERSALVRLGAAADVGCVRRLTDGRRWLSMDRPSTGPGAIRWATGPLVILRND